MSEEVLRVEEEEGDLKEFFIRSRIYNNLMRTARLEAGYESCSALARACNLSNCYVSELEALKRSPRKKTSGGRGHPWVDAGWSNSAETISLILKTLPEDLFPEALWGVKAQPNELELSFEEAAALIGQGTLLAIEDPADLYERKELAETLQRVMGSLTPRQDRILRMRFGIGEESDHTLEEVGQDFEVQRERIRQIEAKALRHLRHPSNSKLLRQFHEDVPLPSLPEVDPREKHLAGKINAQARVERIAAARAARAAREETGRRLALKIFKEEQEREKIARKEAKERKQIELSERAQATREQEIREQERMKEQIPHREKPKRVPRPSPIERTGCRHANFTLAKIPDDLIPAVSLSKRRGNIVVFRCTDCNGLISYDQRGLCPFPLWEEETKEVTG